MAAPGHLPFDSCETSCTRKPFKSNLFLTSAFEARLWVPLAGWKARRAMPVRPAAKPTSPVPVNPAAAKYLPRIPQLVARGYPQAAVGQESDSSALTFSFPGSRASACPAAGEAPPCGEAVTG